MEGEINKVVGGGARAERGQGCTPWALPLSQFPPRPYT